MNKKAGKSSDRNYWLWVTRPKYYEWVEDEFAEGCFPDDINGWWTCHRDTQQGDLAFIWRTSPKRDIGYVAEALSDAYSLSSSDDPDGLGGYACDFALVYRFEAPIGISEFHERPHLQDWPAYRARFQGRVFRIPPEYWQRLNSLACKRNPKYRPVLNRFQKSRLSKRIVLEEQLEDALVADLSRLKPHGYNLKIYQSSPDGPSGRQLVCTGQGGRIDLLCYDTKLDRFVVIELKNVKATFNTFGQISSYMGWVKRHIAGRKPVVGLVISRGQDSRFESSLATTSKVFHVDLEDLGFA